MAIPNDYIDKIKNKDSGESRIISPAADKVRVDNENFEGTDLDEVLNEVAAAIDEAGSGDGTVTGVKVGNTPYGPDGQGVVDLSTPFAGKVDKNGTDSLMTAAEHTKLQNLPTADQLTQQLGDKANDADVVKSISVNNVVQQKNNGNVNIVVEGEQGKSAYQSYYDTTSDNPKMTEAQWVASLKGEKGDTGNVEFEDLEDLVALLVNDLDTGGDGNFLSAEMGKRLKSKVEEVYQRVQSIYSLLAGIAFTADKPAASSILPALDWGNPKHVVTFNLTLANVTVMRNGVAVSNGTALSIEELTSLTLDIVPDTGLSFLRAPTVTFGGNSVTPTLNQDGSYSVEVTMPQTDVTMAITAGATAIQTVTANTIDCTLDNVGNVGLGGSYSGQLTAASHSTMTDAYVKVTMNCYNVTSSAYDASTGEIEIATVTGDIVVEAIAVAVKPTKFLVSNGGSYCDLGFIPTSTMSYRCLYKFSGIKRWGANIAAMSNFALPKARSDGGKNWFWQFAPNASASTPATINPNTEYEFIIFRGGTSTILCNGQVIATDVVRDDFSSSPFAFTHAGNPTSNDALLVGSVLYIEVFDLVNGVDTLIHRFVPETQNGVNGFLDTVTNTFISSASSAAFTISNR